MLKTANLGLIVDINNVKSERLYRQNAKHNQAVINGPGGMHYTKGTSRVVCDVCGIFEMLIHIEMCGNGLMYAVY